MTYCTSVLNRIFGILVEGYISAVSAYRKKSDGRGKWEDVCFARFYYLPINHNSSQSYHRQVLSLIFRSKNGMSRMSIIYCYPLTTLLRRFSKSLLLSQPSVHQQISGIKHTYWLCHRGTGCQRPTQILWPATWRPAKKRQWRD